MGGIAKKPRSLAMRHRARLACVAAGVWSVPSPLWAHAPSSQTLGTATTAPKVTRAGARATSSPPKPDPLESAPLEMDRDPFLPAPQGQVRTRLAPARPVIATEHDQARRVALTLSPVVGGLKLPLAGRTGSRFGFGWSLDTEVALKPWLWLALGWQRLHYFAYAESKPKPQSTRTEPLASRGWTRWEDLSLGIRYAIDDGKIRPIVEAGLGYTNLAQPPGVADGQSEQKCGANNQCGPGLSCVENRCQASAFPSAYIGVEAQWLLARYFSLGACTRYYAAWMPKTGITFPAQWIVSVRASLRY